jgi:hypothetical protein
MRKELNIGKVLVMVDVINQHNDKYNRRESRMNIITNLAHGEEKEKLVKICQFHLFMRMK